MVNDKRIVRFAKSLNSNPEVTPSESSSLLSTSLDTVSVSVSASLSPRSDSEHVVVSGDESLPLAVRFIVRPPLSEDGNSASSESLYSDSLLSFPFVSTTRLHEEDSEDAFDTTSMEKGYGTFCMSQPRDIGDTESNPSLFSSHPPHGSQEVAPSLLKSEVATYCPSSEQSSSQQSSGYSRLNLSRLVDRLRQFLGSQASGASSTESQAIFLDLGKQFLGQIGGFLKYADLLENEIDSLNIETRDKARQVEELKCQLNFTNEKHAEEVERFHNAIARLEADAYLDNHFRRPSPPFMTSMSFGAQPKNETPAIKEKAQVSTSHLTTSLQEENENLMKRIAECEAVIFELENVQISASNLQQEKMALIKEKNAINAICCSLRKAEAGYLASIDKLQASKEVISQELNSIRVELEELKMKKQFEPPPLKAAAASVSQLNFQSRSFKFQALSCEPIKIVRTIPEKRPFLLQKWTNNIEEVPAEVSLEPKSPEITSHRETSTSIWSGRIRKRFSIFSQEVLSFKCKCFSPLNWTKVQDLRIEICPAPKRAPADSKGISKSTMTSSPPSPSPLSPSPSSPSLVSPSPSSPSSSSPSPMFPSPNSHPSYDIGQISAFSHKVVEIQKSNPTSKTPLEVDEQSKPAPVTSAALEAGSPMRVNRTSAAVGELKKLPSPVTPTPIIIVSPPAVESFSATPIPHRHAATQTESTKGYPRLSRWNSSALYLNSAPTTPSRRLQRSVGYIVSLFSTEPPAEPLRVPQSSQQRASQNSPQPPQLSPKQRPQILLCPLDGAVSDYRFPHRPKERPHVKIPLGLEGPQMIQEAWNSILGKQQRPLRVCTCHPRVELRCQCAWCRSHQSGVPNYALINIADNYLGTYMT
eukprot:Gregarina_sp_Poly_1__1100@NODE_126_length_13398_cov_114_014102_g112_i0_p2_GENE_NODE_126_length_13398_cov_114_014102_g112_i0NODE_126_length_13398_cov_114_014102_g112_i0_p2_ORF_typecomplete_len871_score150_05zfC4H2/PF10146_9/1_4e03zfC4H2/PF10146_9/0_0027PRKG1_interact/PF15898_5/1_6PRKG1_interact/PF15898_5/2e02ENT/PF03735_14/0_54Golgin_A5/PF09787_9/1_5Golgin_A5/PF09787_9/14TSC22/PF01166_18/6_4e02TSC22/PF01166_18/1_5TSC22/PF01166_18/7e03SHE3/PF17078_5/18SHE3/PF17078_5/0_52CALCOCO1/PF07888_11/2_9e02C